MIKKQKTRGTALVTGGAKRIGKAICFSLASLGYGIALHYNGSNREAGKCADQIRQKGGRCDLFQCDLSQEHSTQKLIGDVLKKCSRLDVLVNNASVYEKSTIKNLDVQSVSRSFLVNFIAPYILTSHFAKQCKKGHIINILDTHITDNTSEYTAYLLSKKALHDLTKLSAVELAPDIRVNAVSPGLILPPANAKGGHLNRLAKRIPLRKKGHVDQITQSIEFLLNNSYLTGQTIFSDGGEHLI